MANHYFAISPGSAAKNTTANVTVATSSTSSVDIEVRVKDGAAKRIEVVNALEWLASLFGSKNKAVIPVDFLKD